MTTGKYGGVVWRDRLIFGVDPDPTFQIVQILIGHNSHAVKSSKNLLTMLLKKLKI